MEEQRKKFGMEILPSLRKRLKQRAVDMEVPLWSLTQQAIERFLEDATPKSGGINVPHKRDVQKPEANYSGSTATHEQAHQLLEQVLEMLPERRVSAVLRAIVGEKAEVEYAPHEKPKSGKSAASAAHLAKTPGTTQDYPAKQAARLLRRAGKRGSGTEGL